MKPKRRVERVAWLDNRKDSDTWGCLVFGSRNDEWMSFDPQNCSFAAEIQRVLKPSRMRKIKLIAEEL